MRHAAVVFTGFLIFLFAPIPLGGQESDPFDADALADLRELSEWIAMPETLVYRMQDRGGGVLIVDLRNRDRFDEARIRGAVNHPWASGEFRSFFASLPRDRDIFLVSEDGGYGLDALRLMLEAGYTKVYSIEGGMRNWPYGNLLESGK